jgi:hypothetical protein
MKFLAPLLIPAVFSLSSAAHAFNIDGDLKDWLARPSGSSSDWQPGNPAAHYFIEDQSDQGLRNRGGQVFDAEAIYVARDAANFYIAVITGVAPNSKSYPAGDIAFDFGQDGSYEYGVVVESPNQYTNTNSQSDRNGGIGNQGQVYRVNQWNVGLWNDHDAYAGVGQGTQAHPTSVKTGTALGYAELVYQLAKYDSKKIGKLGAFSGNHYLIEARISNSFFSAADLSRSLTLHWTMGCANDPISVDLPSNVPTPDALPMLGIGLMMWLAWQNQNRALTKTPING